VYDTTKSVPFVQMKSGTAGANVLLEETPVGGIFFTRALLHFEHQFGPSKRDGDSIDHFSLDPARRVFKADAAGFVGGKPEYTLGLPAASRELSGRALKAGETLPRGFMQPAEDLDRRCFHGGKFTE